MATRQEIAKAVYRDYATDGDATSGANEPSKAEIRAYEAVQNADIDILFEALATAGMVIKKTKVDLDPGDLAHAAETWGAVIGDATAANNGFYKKSGASGSGSWVWQAGLTFGAASQEALDAEEAAVAAAEEAAASAAEAAYVAEYLLGKTSVGAVASDYMYAKADEDGVPLFGLLARDKTFHSQWGLSEELVQDIGERLSTSASASNFNKGVVIFGDSRTYMCTSTDSLMSNGFIFWLGVLTGQRFDFKFDMSLGEPTQTPPDPAVDNYGKTGDQTGNLVARVAAMLASTTASTIIMWIGTNDISSVSIAISIANIDSLLNTLTNAGRRVILVAETGKGDSDHTVGVPTGNDLADWNQLHEYQLLQRARVNVYVADARPYWIDPASAEGYNIVGKSYDGIHPSTQGGYGVAKALQPVVEALFAPVNNLLPATNAEVFNATHNPRGCLNTNPMLTGASGSKSGQISGDISTGYSCAGGNLGAATIVGSKGTGPNGIAKQIFTFSGTTGSSGSPNAALLSQSILSNLSPGDTIEAVIGIEVATALAGITQFALYISASDAGGIVASGMAGRAPGDTLLTSEWPDETFSGGVLRTPKVKIPADVTLTAATISIAFAAPTSTAISGVVGVYALGIRKVNI